MINTAIIGFATGVFISAFFLSILQRAQEEYIEAQLRELDLRLKVIIKENKDAYNKMIQDLRD